MKKAVWGIGAVLCFTLVLVALVSLAPPARQATAEQDFFSNECAGCHAVAAPTCNGCHAHGPYANSAKSTINIAGATDKASYAPGEQVTVTITGGYRSGWVRALLYDDAMQELARSSGPGGMGGGSGFPVTLSAPAPGAPGAYTWNVAWYGNQAGGDTFGPRWTADPNNPGHGQEIVATNSFTVTAPATAAIQLAPASLAFGAVPVGSSVTQAAEIRNTGTAALDVTGIASGAGTSAEFAFSPAAPLSVAPGGSVSLSVTYTPTDAGTDTGAVVIASNGAAAPVSLQITGTADVPVPPAQPAISLSLAALDFGTAAVGGVPAVRTTDIRNTGSADLTVTGVAACTGTSAAFTSAPAAPFTVAPAGSATLTATFTPAAAGADSGCFTIASNDPAQPAVSLALTGTGSVPPAQAAPAISLSPAALSFGEVPMGSPSAQFTATIQNTGTADLTISGVALCPGTSAEYAWSPATPVTVAPGGSTIVTVAYTPADAGTDSGCLALASNDPAAPSVTLGVTGTGSAPPPPGTQPAIGLAPSVLDFGGVALGGAVSKTATITNVGSVPLSISGLGPCAGTSAEFTWAPGAPLTLDPGASGTLTVTYTPTAAQAATGCLEIASSDPLRPSLQLAVSGNGYEATPGLDLQIRRFKATRYVRLADARPIRMRLEVRNAGRVEGQAPVTLVGVQDGAEVYRETVAVSAPAGKRKAKVTFPAHTASAGGRILWTVTIQDSGPGRNTAKAVTNVVTRDRQDGREYDHRDDDDRDGRHDRDDGNDEDGHDEED
jgi:hypothetical protein